MRLFVAVFLPSEVCSHVSEPLKNSPLIRSLRPVPEEFLHITLKFLGEVPEDRLSIVRSELRNLTRRHRPFRLGLESGGVFPKMNASRVFWVGMTGDQASLAFLAEETESAFDKIGFPLDNRKFLPHLTLARPTSKAAPRPIGERFCKLYKTYKSPLFNVDSIQLARSHLGSTGSRYEVLEPYSLGHSP